jgi:hypothetical protein
MRRGEVVWAAEAAHSGPGDLAAAIAELAEEPGIRRAGTRVEVTLEPPLVQVRRLGGIPPVGSAALSALIANQAGRYFRKNGKPLVTDGVWAEAKRRDRRTVVAAAVEEPWLDAIAAGVRESSLELGSIRLADGPRGLELVSAADRSVRKARARVSVRRLAAAAAAAWTFAGAYAVGGLVLERNRIERDIATLTEPAAAALDARRAVDRARRTIDAVRGTEGSRGTATLRLGQVVSALPRDTWLTSIQWDSAGAGLITGSAKRAADVVAGLERAGVVAPRLEGAAVRESSADGARERFTVRFGSAPG